MDSIGAEVGQKMRSAIKAKLMELDCYVDDELPDYIMVMVANKRTKSQMNEDLQLFLNNKTSTFVDWLHIVLKKLKEVTVTNPDVYNKRSEKRKSSVEILSDLKIKKEKKVKKKKDETSNCLETLEKSLTDDLPITANRLAEQRKIVIMNESRVNNINSMNNDGFDIPLLHEVQGSSEQELEEIEKKIRNVKSRLGLLVDSDYDQDCIKIKAEHDDIFFAKDKEENGKSKKRTVALENDQSLELPKKSTPPLTVEKRPERRRITFTPEENIKKMPVRERLGKRRLSENSNDEPNRTKAKTSLTEFRKEEKKPFRSTRKYDESNRKKVKEHIRGDKQKESILSRLGVMSKVSIPHKEPEEPEQEFKGREVASVVKIKPRIIPSDVPQPNKNLLLKAVAEAQRSVAQTPLVGSNSKPDVYTKKYKNKMKDTRTSSRKLPEVEKIKIKNLLTQKIKETNEKTSENVYKEDEENEYIPKPVSKKLQDSPKYIPSSRSSENGEIGQQFIITLDGIDKTKFRNLQHIVEEQRNSPIKARLDGRRSPSPIVFDKDTSNTIKNVSSNIPDTLPIVHPPVSLKNKERCKYWPNCRQGDKCEFVHPSKNCEIFPHCKFGEKCLYMHPICKFGTACTKRDCQYSHNFTQNAVTRGVPVSVTTKTSSISQTCKFFPNCTNSNCAFYHPKQCRFGKYCKNQSDCTFLHTFSGSLTWRPKNN